ncbi:uncharacterized protein LOC132909637 [Bombus pascuorum]|uniref:uncharacterized protein LOC132909637 n=1 Tax=Bombus pascuorum TaxID=65598 RepID=UPI002135081A|nr:uncharacterized protein LOC132909637 [Bombus pascuorum]
MDWSKDMGLSLVNLYKMKEVLWNPMSSEYHQKTRRHDAWQEIADELSLIIKKPVSALECKRKMDTILSSFRRERVKVRRSLKRAKGDPTKPTGSTWFFYNSLTFLIEKDVLRSKSVNANRDAHSPPPGKRNKSENDKEETPREDECYSYGMFVTNKLKLYSLHTRSEVQHAISDILFNADMGYYNRSHSVSTNTQTESNVLEYILLEHNESVPQEIEFKNAEIEFKNAEIEFKNEEIEFKNAEIEFKNEEISDLDNESEIFN